MFSDHQDVFSKIVSGGEEARWGVERAVPDGPMSAYIKQRKRVLAQTARDMGAHSGMEGQSQTDRAALLLRKNKSRFFRNNREIPSERLSVLLRLLQYLSTSDV